MLIHREYARLPQSSLAHLCDLLPGLQVALVVLANLAADRRETGDLLSGVSSSSSRVKKRRITESAVTPTYGGFRRSKLNTVAGSAMRIFLCEGVVQERSRSGSCMYVCIYVCARQCEISKKAKKGRKSPKRPQLHHTTSFATENWTRWLVMLSQAHLFVPGRLFTHGPKQLFARGIMLEWNGSPCSLSQPRPRPGG